LDDRLITCGICGKSYFAHKRADGSDNAYKCISIRYGENCGNTGISINKLEFAVQYVFLRDMYKLLKFDESENTKHLSDIQALQSELKKIERQQNKLVELYTLERIDLKRFDGDSEKLKKEEARITELIEDNRSKIVNVKKIIFGGLYELKSDGYSLKQPVVTKDQIRQVVKSVVVTKDGRKITENRQDVTLKVDIISVTNQMVTLYLSQRADFFLYGCKNVKFPPKRPQ
jgi:hypothetical protein